MNKKSIIVGACGIGGLGAIFGLPGIIAGEIVWLVYEIAKRFPSQSKNESHTNKDESYKHFDIENTHLPKFDLDSIYKNILKNKKDEFHTELTNKFNKISNIFRVLHSLNAELSASNGLSDNEPHNKKKKNYPKPKWG